MGDASSIEPSTSRTCPLDTEIVVGPARKNDDPARAPFPPTLPAPLTGPPPPPTPPAAIDRRRPRRIRAPATAAPDRVPRRAAVRSTRPATRAVGPRSNPAPAAGEGRSRRPAVADKSVLPAHPAATATVRA